MAQSACIFWRAHGIIKVGLERWLLTGLQRRIPDLLALPGRPFVGNDAASMVALHGAECLFARLSRAHSNNR